MKKQAGKKVISDRYKFIRGQLLRRKQNRVCASSKHFSLSLISRNNFLLTHDDEVSRITDKWEIYS